MPCYSPLKGYKDPETGGLKFKGSGTEETMEVSCGACLGCRLDRSRMWALRITHEASLYERGHGNTFLTLTYNDEHIPKDWSLTKPIRDANGKQIKSSDFQLFMKRLRKGVDKVDKEQKLPKRKIKYYQCGEYGNICKHGIHLDKVKCPLCNLGRPHHHAILFNVRPQDLIPYAQEGDTIRYTSPTIEKLWGKGHIDIGEVTQQSAAYCARYIQKKITGEPAYDHYQRITEDGELIPLVPEYSSMSNGIGAEFYEKYKTDMYPSDETPNLGGGIVPSTPRYYAEKYKVSDPDDYEELIAKRKKYREDHPEEFEPHRLMAKYKVKKASITKLKREL